MMSPSHLLLPVVALLLSSPALAQQTGRYRGTVTDDPDLQRAALQLAFLAETDTSFSGYLSVGEPFAHHSAQFYAERHQDSLLAWTVTADGDTVSWVALQSGEELSGTWAVIGGPRLDLSGGWSARLESGHAFATATGRATMRQQLPWMLTLFLTLAVIARAVAWIRDVSGPPVVATMDTPQPYGVGGWMGLFLFGQGVTAVMAAVQLTDIMAPFNDGTWTTGAAVPILRPMLVLETLVPAAQAVVPPFGIVLTFQRRPFVPRFWFAWLVALFCYGLFDVAATYASIPSLGVIAGPEAVASYRTEVAPIAIQNLRLAMFAAIWMLYWSKSLRVRNTFGRNALDQGPVGWAAMRPAPSAT